MRIGLQDTDWEYIGARLAQSDDVEQANFFKAFLKECKTWGTNHQVQMQLAAVNSKLTREEKEELGMLTYIETKTN